MTRRGELIRVQIHGFALDEVPGRPVLLLRPEKTDEVLPLWLGPAEADAIAAIRSGAESRSPLTYDLFAMSLAGLTVEHQRTEITGLDGNTYFARIILRQERHFVAVDCPPGDGIALAVRTGAEIFVDKTTFEAQKQSGDSFPVRDLTQEG